MLMATWPWSRYFSRNPKALCWPDLPREPACRQRGRVQNRAWIPLNHFCSPPQEAERSRTQKIKVMIKLKEKGKQVSASTACGSNEETKEPEAEC